MKEGKELTIFSVIFLVFSWIMFFVMNTATDFENDTLVIFGFILIIAATAIFIYCLLKNNKLVESQNTTMPETKTNNNTTIQRKELLATNEFTNLTKEKILQLSYEKYEEYMEKYSYFSIFFSDYHAIWKNSEQKEKRKYSKKAEFDFTKSLFMYILLNTNQADEKKTIKFLKNLDADVMDDIKEEFEYDHDLMQKEATEDSDLFVGLDFNKWKKTIFHQLTRMKDSGWDLTDEIFKGFIKDIENGYNAYVAPEKPLDILGDYCKTSSDNERDASTKKIYMFILPIVLIIAMAVLFLIELFGDGGFITDGGWWSVGVFVILIIWAGIGSSGNANTCSLCKKWNALELVGDEIIDSRDSWRTETKYVNGRSYSHQVPIRIERHKEYYKCRHCGEREIKYRDTEHRL